MPGQVKAVTEKSILSPGSVLLLDCLKTKSARLFTHPIDILSSQTLQEVPETLARVERAQADGFHAAGFLAYEAGFAFEPKLQERWVAGSEPLAWFGVYRTCENLGLEDAKALLAEQPASGRAYVEPPEFDWSKAEYDKAFEQVQDHLKKGDIYQVNLAMKARFRHGGAPASIFLELLERQPVEYAALLVLDECAIVSLSPELFLERKGQMLRTRPMKGTARRGIDVSEDRRIARDLARDTKQRAENTMIVDLMRNDLSRIADAGSVNVSELCTVERYKTIHQMTSTVEGQLPKGTGFARIVENLFPCGSITGAPKLSAMTIADTLEPTPRGVYTGSIGCLEPNGDFRFNVAIRTLVLRNDGTGEAGAGSGVVYDSGATPEYDECRLKLKFVTSTEPEFDLLETLAYRPDCGILLKERHLRRLADSARYFAFPLDEDEVEDLLEDEVKNATEALRLRLAVDSQGRLHLTSTPLQDTLEGQIWNVALAPDPIQAPDVFRRHKTTYRGFYDDVRHSLSRETGCQEVLFVNKAGYLTEGSFTTLFVEREGVLLTPALRHGLLPGTFRGGLLESGRAVEADLTLADLRSTDRLFVGNSVRGLVPIRMIGRSASAAIAQC